MVRTRSYVLEQRRVPCGYPEDGEYDGGTSGSIGLVLYHDGGSIDGSNRLGVEDVVDITTTEHCCPSPSAAEDYSSAVRATLDGLRKISPAPFLPRGRPAASPSKCDVTKLQRSEAHLEETWTFAGTFGNNLMIGWVVLL